jgi:hypothetical protein
MGWKCKVVHVIVQMRYECTFVPELVLVGDGEALASGRVAEVGDELAHGCDRLPRVPAPLQRDPDQ